MKKNKAKILIGFGAITTLATAGSAVLSCGISDQQKLDGITLEMVTTFIETQDGFVPNPNEDAPTDVPSKTLTNATLDGISGLTITILNWTTNINLGSVTFDVNISKTGLTDKNITGVTYDGWNVNQNKLSGITAPMVADYVKTQTGFIPSVTTHVPATAPSLILTNATINGLGGLKIAISNWKSNDLTGSVTFDVNISKEGLIAKDILGVTYDGWNVDQGKLNAVTTEMVADYVKTQAGFIPSATENAPALPRHSIFNVTLNGVDGLTIEISNWVANITLGSVTFDVRISKDDLKDAKDLTGVTYDGWKTDQSKLNAVTAEMVADYVKKQPNFIPSAIENVPKTAPSPTLTNVKLNGLDGLTIAITNWVPNISVGSVMFNARISEGVLTINNITTTYNGWMTDQNRLDAVTTSMVADYVKTQKGFIPSINVDAPTTAPTNTIPNVTLNGVDGLTIEIANWTTDINIGSVTFDVRISKDELKDAKDLKGVTYDGWSSYQNKLNGITANMVADLVKTQADFIPNPNIDAPNNLPRSPLTDKTLNGVSGLTITISNWWIINATGSVTFNVSISKPGLTAKSITGVTYNGFKAYGTTLSNDNVNNSEGKLWSWTNGNTLTIFYGVIELHDDIHWGSHTTLYHDVTSFNLPESLQTIGDNVFREVHNDALNWIMFPASLRSIGSNAFNTWVDGYPRFRGDVPGKGGTTRTLYLGDGAFADIPVDHMEGGDWYNWAKTHYPNAFRR